MSDPDPSPESRGLAVTSPSRCFPADPGLDGFYVFISASVSSPSEVGAKSCVRFICICLLQGNPQVEPERSEGTVWNLIHFQAERNCRRFGDDEAESICTQAVQKKLAVEIKPVVYVGWVQPEAEQFSLTAIGGASVEAG